MRSFSLSELTCPRLKIVFYLTAFISISHSQSYCKLNVFGHNVYSDEIHQYSCKLDLHRESDFSFKKKIVLNFHLAKYWSGTRCGKYDEGKAIAFAFTEPVDHLRIP